MEVQIIAAKITVGYTLCSGRVSSLQSFPKAKARTEVSATLRLPTAYACIHGSVKEEVNGAVHKKS